MPLTLPLLLLLGAVTTTSPATKPSSRPGGEFTPPPHRDVAGARTPLPHGQLYAPDYYHPATDRIDLVIFFLCPPWLSEQNFHDSRTNALLFTANSATIKAGFQKPEDFDALLAEATNGKPLGHLCLVSFSGGYTAVRDVLRHESTREKVTDVLLLDSLYAGRIPADSNTLDPEQMRPFLDFARRAADGTATMTFTQLFPPEAKYRTNTTTLAADYLIQQLHLTTVTTPADNPSPARKLLYRADRDNLHILGFAGMTNQDHFDHLYQSADLLKFLPIPPAAPATTLPAVNPSGS